jgi:hypothetical protein
VSIELIVFGPIGHSTASGQICHGVLPAKRILALQERKAALADSMYQGATGRKQPLFTEGDLAELLKPLSI